MEQQVGGLRQEEGKRPGEKRSNTDEKNQRALNILRSLREISSFLQGNAKLVEVQSQLNPLLAWGMWELHDNPGLKVSELADTLVIHKSTCSNMLNKLQKKNLVYKDRGNQDQRVVRLYLTGEGTQMLETMPRPDQGAIARALHDFSAADLAEMEKILGRLASATHTAKDEGEA